MPRTPAPPDGIGNAKATTKGVFTWALRSTATPASPIGPERAFNGVTLYSTQGGDKTHLVDMNGKVVHEWTPPAPAKPYYGFLRDNGNLLLRCYDGNEPYKLGGYSGVLVELDWDSNVVWRYDNPVIHHDHTLLRNGNIMVIGWEELTKEQASRVQGGKAGSEGSDPRHAGRLPAGVDARQRGGLGVARLEEAGPGTGSHLPPGWPGEWTHCNGVIELQDGNICVSFRLTSQVLFIEKATGDVYWRWGPREDFGTSTTRRRWRTATSSSSTTASTATRAAPIPPSWRLTPRPTKSCGSSAATPCCRSTARTSAARSGSPTGNTFICDGRTGRLFEVTTEGDVVWEFMNPEIAPWRGEKLARAVFRALRYPVDGPEVRGPSVVTRRHPLAVLRTPLQQRKEHKYGLCRLWETTG